MKQEKQKEKVIIRVHENTEKKDGERQRRGDGVVLGCREDPPAAPPQIILTR